MEKKGPIELGDMEIFSDVLEDLAERGEEVRGTFATRDPEHVQEAFGHSVEFSTAWAASIAAIDQAYTDGNLSNAEQKTLLYAYLYGFLGAVYIKQDAKETKRREEVDFLTGFITQHYPTVDPQVEVRPLEPEEQRGHPFPRNEVRIEFIGPTGSREGFTAYSNDLTRDDDRGMEEIAYHLSDRLECQREMEEEEELEP